MYRALGILAIAISCSIAAISQTTVPDADLWSSSKQTKFVEFELETPVHKSTGPSQSILTSFAAHANAAKPERFRWGRAILQSANFMTIQQGVMLATDKWSRYELTHGKWFKTYMKAISGNDRWNDGDPLIDNYVGHPMEGALTGYIQVQNDPSSRNLEFQNSSAYWKSRMKAMAWNAVYSAQFEIGPFGEASIQKLGSYEYRNCPTCKVVNGAGMVDFVITPTVGTSWILMEDVLDKYVAKKAETKFGRNFWTNFIRCVVNPARSGANILDGRSPWHRPSRDEIH